MSPEVEGPVVGIVILAELPDGTDKCVGGTVWLDISTATNSSGAMEVFEPVSILRSLLERGRVIPALVL